MTESNLNWLQKWYAAECDGDWEHEYGVNINTVGNPGWSVTIEYSYTDLDGFERPVVKNKNYETEDNWFFTKFENNIFEASGDPTKLDLMIGEFRKVWEKETQ